MRYPLIAGNWKMFKTISEAKSFCDEFKKIYNPSDVDVVICGPYLTLETLVDEFKDTNIKVGAQNCHFMDDGAFTGEVSVSMLKEIGVSFVIIGHSERRKYYNELDSDVNKKVKKLLENGLTPIICVGEDLSQREHNFQDRLVSEQVENALLDIDKNMAQNVVIAYEPIWAIGTGKTATNIQAGHMCELIRNTLIDMYDDETADKIRILYGGSVKPDNISGIMDELEIDGALVGGASLNAASFNDIINF